MLISINLHKLLIFNALFMLFMQIYSFFRCNNADTALTKWEISGRKINNEFDEIECC